MQKVGADISTQDKHSRNVPFVLVGVAAAFFLLFIYGYPRLFLLIEASRPDHFERNVADALAAGNRPKALKIAREATRALPRDPMAYTVYGRVLLECGKASEAVEQLTKAVGIQREPAPSHRETRKPYYFAPARLTRGKCYLEQGNVRDALADFELARAYAVPAGVEYGDFHAALYHAYAEQGLWARALEFGEPSDQELDDLAGPDLVAIARVCEGNGDWKLTDRVAGRLLTYESFAAEAQYLLGRAELARDRYEASLAHLEQAASEGYAHAAYFLGTAFEKSGQPAEAIQAFLRVRFGDVYRPFALAKAMKLLADVPDGKKAFTSVTTEELLNQVDQEIEAIRLSGQPVQCDGHRRFTPLAIRGSEALPASGGRFPLLILWEDGRPPVADPTQVTLSSTGGDDHLLLRRGTDNVLQLQWVENLVNWEVVERLPAGAGPVPGWIDTAHEWFGLSPDYAVRVEKDDGGNACLGITRLTWFYSIPIPVQGGGGYLLAGRLKGAPDKGSLGWQFLDETETVLFEGDVVDTGSPDAWTSHAGYVQSQFQWNAVRVTLGIRRCAGTVLFDNVMLVQIEEPLDAR